MFCYLGWAVCSLNRGPLAAVTTNLSQLEAFTVCPDVSPCNRSFDSTLSRQQVFCLVDLGGEEGRAAPIRVVQQHHPLVALGDPLRCGRRRHAEDERGLSPAHLGLIRTCYE